MRLLGLDPGLTITGWGILDAEGSRLIHIANGAIASDRAAPIARRLVEIYDGIMKVIDEFRPDEAAVEETFVNKNPSSTLKLGLARGAVLLAPAKAGLDVAEYSANAVKKAVVGVGHADKDQVAMMVRRLLANCRFAAPDSADALAVAICHSHHSATKRAWAMRAMAGATR